VSERGVLIIEVGVTSKYVVILIGHGNSYEMIGNYMSPMINKYIIILN
jgi:hypothetical protein